VIWASAVSLVNARVAAGDRIADSIRFSSRVLSIGERPKRGDTVVDLQGSFVLPGLVNAHDHLELNHYGRIKGRDRYENASGWIADMGQRLSSDPAIRRGREHPLIERLFIGGLKNLLAGVTTVAHHNPFYAEMRRTMPIRVVRRYGWAHSFFLEKRPAGARGEPGGDVAARWQTTSPDAPFFVHLAEGIDDDARGELPRLEALGCLKPNTVIVHGLAIDENGWRRVARTGAGLVWCPASNAFLFGETALVGALIDGADEARVTVALGTDSRVTGSRDLLDELREARAALPVAPHLLLRMVTSEAAKLLRQNRAGRLTIGAPADVVVIPALAGDPGAALLQATRRDVRLVIVDGRPLIGDPDFAAVFKARRVTARPLRVDTRPKLGESGLVRRIAGCPIAEPGVSAA
jgi:cytosine/adenosine deaminase-related metal-dependent hydrolase